MVYINLVKSVRLGKIYFIMVLSTSIKTEKQRNALNKQEGKKFLGTTLQEEMKML